MNPLNNFELTLCGIILLQIYNWSIPIVAGDEVNNRCSRQSQKL